MEKTSFNRGEIIKLIKLYKKKEALWNINSILYKRLDLKKKGWAEIASQMQTNIDFIKRKMKSLRTSYNSEKKKVYDSRNTESNSDNVYVPILFYYDEMKFLDDAIIARSASNVETENDAHSSKVSDNFSLNTYNDDFTNINFESNFHSEIIESRIHRRNSSKPNISPEIESRIHQRKNKNKKNKITRNAVMDKILKVVDTQIDSAQIFGDFVADRLRQLSIQRRRLLENQIQRIILDACEEENY